MKIKNFFKKGELKILWPFYAKNLTPMFFFYSLFAVLYFTQIGLSLVQIGLLYTVMSIATILFEIPTGAFADIYGRKSSVVFGYFLIIFVVLGIYFTSNFSLLLVLYALWGIAYTFVSGADNAWVMDLIKRSRIKGLADKFYATGPSIYCFSGFMSGLIGAFFVGLFGVKSIWLFFAASNVLAVVFLSFGKEYYKRKKQHVKKHFKEFVKHNKEAINYSRKDHNISRIMVASVFFAFVTYIATADIIWVPLLKSLGMTDASLGFLISASWIVGIFSPHLAKSIAKKMNGRKNFLLVVLSLMVVVLLLLFWAKTLVWIIAINIAFAALLDFWAPVNFPMFQSFIPSKTRATILSLRSFIFSLMGAITPLFIGFLAEFVDLKIIISASAILLIPVIIIYSKLKEK